MAIPMAKLCEDAQTKYNMLLVGGKGGTENTVRWVHMVEDREVPDFLHGGELIFTTGIGHIGDDANMLEFTRNLHAHGAAGVVFNIGPYIRSVPPDVAAFANAHDFPVFTLPWNVHIIDITYDFCNRIIENEKAEISLMQAFKNLIFGPGSAADSLPALEKNGFSAAADYRVLAVAFRNRDDRSVTAPLYAKNRALVWKQFANSASPAAIIAQNTHLIVVKQHCSAAAVERICSALHKSLAPGGLHSIVGVSDEGSGYQSVPALYRQAEAAFITAQLERRGCCTYADIGLNRLILSVGSKPFLSQYAHSVLAPVLAYDEAHGTDCADLLRTYIAHDCSVNAVAESGGVHRNTVNNRMKHIRTLLGGELTESRKAELLLAYQIMDLLPYLS